MKKNIILLSIFIICFSSPVKTENRVDIVTYADFSHIRDIAVSLSSVYFATSEGIIKYDKYEDKWLQPFYWSSGVDYRNIFRIYIDQFDKKLYAKTELNAYEYDLLLDDWFFVNEIPVLDNLTSEARLPSILFVPPEYTYLNDGYIQDFAGFEYPINKLVGDGSGVKWMSLWGLGAAKVETSNIVELLPYGLLQNRVNTIYNSEGTIIIGGANIGSRHTGLTFFDVNNNEFSYKESGLTYDLPSDDINCIEEDTKYIYLATSGGLTVLDRKTHEVKRRYTERSGLLRDNLLSLKKVKNKLFIGSIGGLQVLSTDTDSLKIVYANEFSNQEIYDFELTDTTLWIASSVGAYQLHLETYELKKFSDPHNIIFSRAFNIEKYQDELFIASSDGMVRLNLKTGYTTPYISDLHGTNYRAMAVNEDVAFLTSDLGFEMYYLTDSGYSNEREFLTSDGLPSQYVYDLSIDGDYLWIGTDRGLSLFLWNDPDRID